MVHALEETHRVLLPGGALIDLRPTMRDRPVEVDLPTARLRAGAIDATASNARRVAADQAMRAALEAGLFRAEHMETFWQASEMDTLADLREYAASLRQTFLPAAVFQRVERLLAHESAAACIRVSREIVIARYRRV